MLLWFFAVVVVVVVGVLVESAGVVVVVLFVEAEGVFPSDAFCNAFATFVVKNEQIEYTFSSPIWWFFQA